MMCPNGLKSRAARKAPAGSESCVVAGQPALRSVDSERAGLCGSLEMGLVVSADVPEGTAGNRFRSTTPEDWNRSPGSQGRGKPARGTRELGRSQVSVAARAEPCVHSESKTPGAWEVRARNRSDEVGEPTL